MKNELHLLNLNKFCLFIIKYVMILKEHKNIIVNILKSIPDIKDIFEVIDDDKNLKIANTLTIKIKNTPFLFIIEQSPKTFDAFKIKYNNFNPSLDWSIPPDRSIQPELYNLSIGNIIPQLSNWINYNVLRYYKELKSEDLWQKILLERNNQKDESFTKSINEYFSLEEQKQIELQIEELKKLIQKEFNPIKEELVAVNIRLDYLEDAVKRLNKYDWQGTVIQTLVSISIALSLDTQKGQKLIELFKTVFHNIQLLLN